MFIAFHFRVSDSDQVNLSLFSYDPKCQDDKFILRLILRCELESGYGWCEVISYETRGDQSSGGFSTHELEWNESLPQDFNGHSSQIFSWTFINTNGICQSFK